jgi:quinolinate synthase
MGRRPRDPDPRRVPGRNVAAQTHIKIIAWPGRCEVHERFSAEDVAELREAHPGVVILAHPECPPDVLAVGGLCRLHGRALELREKEAAAARWCC